MAKQEYWFKAKRYGWGWYPATWQGWLCMMLFVLLVILGAVMFLDENVQTKDMVFYFVWIGLWSVGLFAVSYKKGEKPGWHWGK